MTRLDILVDKLDTLMENCRRRLDQLSREEFLSLWNKIDYRIKKDGRCGPTTSDYENPLFDACYMIKYGYAYAFEYVMIYDSILRTYKGLERRQKDRGILGIISLGCGSALDVWALEYAKEKLLDETKDGDTKRHHFLSTLVLSYEGYDQAKWAIRFAEPIIKVNTNTYSSNRINDMITQGELKYFYDRDKEINSNYKPSFSANIRSGIDISEIFNSNNYHVQNYNVFMFGKLLNEMSEEEINIFLQAASCVLNKRKEIYFCFSFGKSEINKTAQKSIKEFAEQLFNRICEKSTTYSIHSHILEKSRYSDILISNQQEQSQDANIAFNRVYSFKINSKIDKHFECIDPAFKAGKNKDFVCNLKTKHTIEDDQIVRLPMTTMNHFQIQVIRLTKDTD